MAKRRKPGRPKSRKTKGAKRGRKPIFTPAQKRIVERMIREALRAELRNIVRDL